MGQAPVLVVGTTPDYVVRLFESLPGDSCFLIDSRFKGDALLERVDRDLILFAPIEGSGDARPCLDRYPAWRGFSPRGVACYDCESLILAGELAACLHRPFPTTDAIKNARNKFLSRRIWQESGIPSPRAAMACGLRESLAFFRQVKQEIVLKPLSGSGSELLFRCRDEEGISHSVQVLMEELPRRKSNPLFRPVPGPAEAGPMDPCRSWVVEEFVPGPEFSCDFILEGERVTVLRETGKVKAPDQTFGSILAYTLPPEYPEGFSSQGLPGFLKAAARSLGFTWGHFMADFILMDGRPVIIEMTPRPGGDSIPDLLEAATGVDILRLHLEFAGGGSVPTDPLPRPPQAFASINLYAPEAGAVTRLDPAPMLSLPWVRRFFCKKNAGDRVLLPPQSYDHRLIGYCIVTLEEGLTPAEMSVLLNHLLDLEIEAEPGPVKVRAGKGA